MASNTLVPNLNHFPYYTYLKEFDLMQHFRHRLQITPNPVSNAGNFLYCNVMLFPDGLECVGCEVLLMKCVLILR